MAIPININDLINGNTVESSRIEFKSDYNPNEIIRTVCAFANDIDNMGGGYIVIGVEEKDGSPVFPIKGIEKNRIDSILKKLHNHCHFIEPLYQPVVEPIFFQDVWLIVIWVSGGFGRPYKAPRDVTGNQSIKHYYIRKFSSTVIADLNEEKELFYVSSDIPFDDRENLAADVSDLNVSLMLEHLKEIGSELFELSKNRDALSIATDMQLVGGSNEFLKPRNVGILMFSNKTDEYFRNAIIEIVDIPNPTGEGMTEKVFRGPIQYQLRMALEYIRSYIIAEKVFKLDNQAEAIRVYNYPFRAVEEILSNAVYHRSYQVQEPITVRVTEEFMEITSFPGFDRSITDSKIEQYDFRAKIYRNRRIGDFLKELHLIEGRNTGFPTALKALSDNGSDKFRIDMDPDRQYLSVIIPVHNYFLPKKKSDDEFINRILDILCKSAMTVTEIARALGYKGITRKLRLTIDRLCDEGYIVKSIRGGDIVYICLRKP
ncbi:MAG: putative DNA binding domain-containing protein [Bullifex sp.]|nr:putative DNA binding domain-containing protein [Spirochaetales bacterium]MDY5777201.1 putative DNA binding domain-containing protein [Bullifex sp.]